MHSRQTFHTIFLYFISVYYIFLPDDDGLFAAGHETETEFRVAGEFDFARLRRLLPPILAGILVRRRFVQVTIAIIRDAKKKRKIG